MQVADVSAAIEIEILQAFSGQWDASVWGDVMAGPFTYLFDLPKSQFAADEDATAVVSPNAQYCKLTASMPAILIMPAAARTVNAYVF